MTEIAALHRELGIPADLAALRGWPLQREPDAGDLDSIGRDIFDREQSLIRPAAEAWRALQAAASQDNVVLRPVSAFRSVAYQADVIRQKLSTGRSVDMILRVNALPGYSEHHTGRALDVTTPGAKPVDETFENSAAFAWLRHHAGRFGFTLSYPRDNALGMAYEPWHWCWHD
jgi:D-alanyl-D-alanine carboxypeptidase